MINNLICIFCVTVKKKRGRQPSSTAESYSELEEGVEWYEEEKCAADKCKRPKNKRVKWVSSKNKCVNR